jgi:riboflavin kinase/FMN adenylyltransferase
MTKIIYEKDLPLSESVVCTIGNFDGFHKGHREILHILKEEAEKSKKKSMVITFYPHPKKVLQKDSSHCNITNIETRNFLLSKEGIDYLLVIKFDENFYKKSPEQFLKFLTEKVKCKKLIVGHDWKFGYKKEGDIKLAKEIGKKIGLEVFEIPPITKNGKRISSTIIRQFLKEGDVEKASKYLGRQFFIFGKVVSGDKKGREIGFPTINIQPPEDFCLRKGVYAGYVIIKNKRYPAVINYGNRPTVDGKKVFIEVHVLEPFKDKLDEEYIQVCFLKFIRDEKKFPDIEKLQKQINEDIKTAKEVLKVAK